MTEQTFVVTAAPTPPGSPARVAPSDRTPLRVGLVQHQWIPDAEALRATLYEGIGLAAARTSAG